MHNIMHFTIVFPSKLISTIVQSCLPIYPRTYIFNLILSKWLPNNTTAMFKPIEHNPTQVEICVCHKRAVLNILATHKRPVFKTSLNLHNVTASSAIILTHTSNISNYSPENNKFASTFHPKQTKIQHNHSHTIQNLHLSWKMFQKTPIQFHLSCLRRW